MDKQYIENRLTYLFSLKSEVIPMQKEFALLYSWKEVISDDPYKSSYRTNIIHSIINAKAAEILAWMQEYDFIPLDDEWLRNVLLFKKIWDYEWLSSNTDREIAKAIYSWLKYWDWYLYEWTRTISRKVKVPYYDWAELKFEEKEIIEKDWIHCEYIPWENIYHDWISIEEANEVIWIKDWDRKSFMNTFWDRELPKWRHYYIWASNTINLDWDINSDNIVTELRYYNKAEDILVIVANWVIINSTPIPYKHKELPFVSFSDYILDNRVYNMWEYELLWRDAAYKDALRSLNIDVIKAQFWFTVIDPDADFDEATIEIWTNSFARLSPDDIKHFAPNINANNVIQAENQADNDIIIKSWIDFKSQLLWPWETATKTQAKESSSRKRINLNLKLNWYSFFWRLAKLRAANIQLEYSKEWKKIPVKWMSIDENGVAEVINWGYWLFTTKPEYVKWKFNIIPITESILWINSEKEKVKILEYAQVAWNITWEDWAPVIKWDKLVEELSRRMWVDFEKLTQSKEAYKSPEWILKELKNMDNGMTNDTTDPTNPNFIPPEQRSWAVKSVPTIWWISS